MYLLALLAALSVLRKQKTKSKSISNFDLIGGAGVITRHPFTAKYIAIPLFILSDFSAQLS
jgi:hypothetical protein